MPGCPDSDELVTFEDLLEGKAGPVEQQSALQFQRLTDAGQTSQHVEPPGRVFADETGPDLRIGDRAGKRKRAVYATTDPYADPADASAADPAALRKQRLQQAAQEGRLHGPRPMPAGWKVVLRESKRDGRLLKRYQAPNGKVFKTFQLAENFWKGKSKPAGPAKKGRPPKHAAAQQTVPPLPALDEVQHLSGSDDDQAAGSPDDAQSVIHWVHNLAATVPALPEVSCSSKLMRRVLLRARAKLWKPLDASADDMPT